MVAADGSPLLLETSVEHPALWNHKQVEAQHVFFSRHAAARKEIDGIIERARAMTTMLDDPTPQRNHLFLGVSLHHDRLELVLKLHPDAQVDRQNLVRKLDDAWEHERFLELVRGLSGVSAGDSPAAELDGARLTALLATLGEGKLLALVDRVPRAEAIAAGAGLAARVREGLVALLPVYQFIAWSRDNDYVSMRDRLKQEKAVKAKKGLVKNDKVTIVRGPFSGRTGLVQEIDARGALKVLVGTVAVKVAADEVEKA
jgi:transcription antitermination factor NusG